MFRLLPLLFLPLLLQAAAPPARYPTLSAKDAADGWLLLFDGETTFGWDVQGEARVEGGVIVLGGKKASRLTHRADFTYFRFEVEVSTDGKEWSRAVRTREPASGGVELEGAFGLDRASDRFFGPPVFGPPLLLLQVPAGKTVYLRNLKLRPEATRPLFNGKDLSGWKRFQGDPKREKSTFSVTKEGHLNVKNGPGDLQTETLYDDFVLQLECISNGKHLNSGIFFRAIPGEYQNGYEAQVQHDFSQVPPRKYLVDQYDPMTHKLVGKREVFSHARDFGTGAIYRRVPARRAVAVDGEWFTMTVVARGRHIATWVNGVQQVDWVDNRAPHKNPRNGYRGEAGAISIQGHDPTTDLSFRNLRIAALPRAKK